MTGKHHHHHHASKIASSRSHPTAATAETYGEWLQRVYEYGYHELIRTNQAELSDGQEDFDDDIEVFIPKEDDRDIPRLQVTELYQPHR